MIKNNIIQQLDNIGILPVVSLGNPEQAYPVAQAVADGGIPAIEVTFRSGNAAESIKKIVDSDLDILVGAGTVLTCEQAELALEGGAHFIVTPGFNEKVIEYVLSKGGTVIPGCSSPTEVEKAIAYGLEAVKLFPAGCLGGTRFVKALAGPYPQMHYVPTGGIGVADLPDYAVIDQVAACGGSWLIPADALEREDYAGISRLCKEAVASLLGFEMRHIGINNPGNDEAQAVADRLAQVFGIPRSKEGKGSIFIGTYAEVMKKMFLGTNGHIAMATNSIRRAIYQLERSGVRMNVDSAAINPQGKMVAMYLEEEFGGFAFHLLQK